MTGEGGACKLTDKRLTGGKEVSKGNSLNSQSKAIDTNLTKGEVGRTSYFKVWKILFGFLMPIGSQFPLWC